MIKLGELLYEGQFDHTISLSNDRNGHLGNPGYFSICEQVRYDWMSQFGWNDKNFNS